MRIIQLPPVISSRGNSPPSSKPGGTASNGVGSHQASQATGTKHFLIINNTPRRYNTSTSTNNNNNTRKAMSPALQPTCERLDMQGIQTFIGAHPRDKELPAQEPARGEEAEKENSAPGDGDENITMGPGHVKNMIALFSRPSDSDLDRSRSMSPTSEERSKSTSPRINGKVHDAHF